MNVFERRERLRLGASVGPGRGGDLKNGARAEIRTTHGFDCFRLVRISLSVREGVVFFYVDEDAVLAWIEEILCICDMPELGERWGSITGELIAREFRELDPDPELCCVGFSPMAKLEEAVGAVVALTKGEKLLRIGVPVSAAAWLARIAEPFETLLPSEVEQTPVEFECAVAYCRVPLTSAEALGEGDIVLSDHAVDWANDEFFLFHEPLHIKCRRLSGTEVEVLEFVDGPAGPEQEIGGEEEQIINSGRCVLYFVSAVLEMESAACFPSEIGARFEGRIRLLGDLRLVSLKGGRCAVGQPILLGGQLGIMLK